ncbi:FtsK/SpoIIIE domain-containing protein [Flexivirga caeni]|uniref:FHA domain-containing protein n=1 Tax=Flexivirga caeni TaxID=2294115 RepID=A0A3M9MAT2_9MICO|nr:FtsK/SpoIIIE domain-containing protein [Flexivirga caeni]RNI22277.1 FHA domain-containing protein [Flexivirga caeni]
MKLKLTYRPLGKRSTQDIVVTADATATAADLADALHSASPDAPLGQQLTLRVSDSRGGSRLLPPEVSLIQSGLRSGAAVELSRPEPDPSAVTGATVAVLRVTSGADKGVEVGLPIGSSAIGRAPDCAVRLSDPTVSKVHAQINVGERVEIVDLNSANGVHVGGVRVSRVVVEPGDRVTVGHTEITLGHVVAVGAEASVSTDVAFVRAPRVVPRPVQRAIELPELPQPQRSPRLPWLAMIAPLVMGVVLFLVMHTWTSVLFVAMSPILLLGNWWTTRSQAAREREAALRTFDVEFDQARTDFAQACATELSELRTMYPSVAECVQAIGGLGPVLWSRRPEHPEFLQVRLGTGPVASHLTSDKVRRSGYPDLTERLRALQHEYVTIDDAPVVADLREVGGIGLAGERTLVDGVARALVTQLAALHSPAEVVVVCMTSHAGRPRWAWLRWLPHTSSPHSPLEQHLSADPGATRILLAQLEDLVDSRAADMTGATAIRGPIGDESTSAQPVLPSILVVVDDSPVERARMIRVAERGPDVGVHVLWVSDRVAELPGACRSFLHVDAGGVTSAGMVRRGSIVGPITCESVGIEVATTIGRTLAPVVDAGAPVEDDSDLPRSVPMVSLLGQEECDDPDVVLARWKENESLTDRTGQVRRRRPASLRALVGHAGAEPFVLDLRVNGPHALVGGTTGAGKSEFLQSWVLGMAHANSPDRVTFLFVDYKGGSAFARCVALPHCVGLVTDLSPYLVRRALRSLRAELRYREHLLNAKQAKDLLELEQTGDPECPPSLIIVVDEFAALVGEVPEFVDGVVDVAQRGRSLGLHLILATQRPTGVIKENLRANTNLRVALRMADEQDSTDVLGVPMAAHFDPDIPGRGAAKSGPGRITPFQSAFPGSRTPAVAPPTPIQIADLGFGMPRVWESADRTVVTDESEPVPQDIERIVAAVSEAARRGRVPAPRKPWQETLADVYNLQRLSQRDDTQLVLGVLDDPDQQDQVLEHFRPDEDGNILYYGASGSGKSTALRSLALASAITPRGGPVHVYGLDFAGGALSVLEAMPNVAAIVPGDDDERVKRTFRLLRDVVEERAVRYSRTRAGTLTDYRKTAQRTDEPRFLVLLDGYSAFRAAYEGVIGNDAYYSQFLRLLADGRAVGVHFAMTADRAGAVPPSVSSAFLRRIVLRQADEESYSALGVPRDVIGPTSPPGRAMQVGLPQELQLAVLGESMNVAVQARDIDDLAAEVALHRPLRPAPIEALPSQVAADSLPRSIGGRPPLGIEDETLQPIAFAPQGVVLVGGPAQSGRTNAVAWLAIATSRVAPEATSVYLSARRSAVDMLPIWEYSAVGQDEIADLLPRLQGMAEVPSTGDVPGLCVFAEAFLDLNGSPVEAALLTLATTMRRNGHFFVAESETSAWGSFSMLGKEIRSSGTALLLTPDQQDGELVRGAALPRVRRTDFPPGRGYWIHAGRAARVQLPVAMG